MMDNGRNSNLLPFILVGFGLLLLIGSAFLLQNPLSNDLDLQDPLIFSPIEMDQPAPELTLYNLDGNQVSLSDFSGQVVLLNNWATWCPPCREEMPEFKTYYDQHKDAGFQILAVEAGQPEAEVRAFVEELGLDFIVLLDPENKSLITFQQASLPNTFVIDRRGQLRLAWIGAINSSTLEKYLTPLLEENQ
jgi:peroxiredoxin